MFLMQKGLGIHGFMLLAVHGCFGIAVFGFLHVFSALEW